jgi:hypothetical protein
MFFVLKAKCLPERYARTVKTILNYFLRINKYTDTQIHIFFLNLLFTLTKQNLTT